MTEVVLAGDPKPGATRSGANAALEQLVEQLLEQLRARTADTGSAGAVTPRDFGLVKVAYTVRELLAILPIGRTRLYEFIRAGKLPRLKPSEGQRKNSQTVFLAVDIAHLLSELRAASPDAAAVKGLEGTQKETAK